MPRPALAAAKPAADPVAAPVPPAVDPARTRPGDDRFIVEGAQAPPTAPAPPKPTAAPSPAQSATTGGRFLQVPTFSSKANADATATSPGRTIRAAGRLWPQRVRTIAGDGAAQA